MFRQMRPEEIVYIIENNNFALCEEFAVRL